MKTFRLYDDHCVRPKFHPKRLIFPWCTTDISTAVHSKVIYLTWVHIVPLHSTLAELRSLLAVKYKKKGGIDHASIWKEEQGNLLFAITCPEEVMFAVTLAKKVPSQIQSYAESVRQAFTTSATLISLLVSPYLFDLLVETSSVLIICCAISFIAIYLRRKQFLL